MWWFWFRRQIRRRTSPIQSSTAEKWDKRLAFVKFFTAWTAVGALFLVYKDAREQKEKLGIKEPPVRPGVYYARLLGLDNVKIVRVQGMTVVEETEYKASNDKTVVQEKDTLQEREFFGTEDNEVFQEEGGVRKGAETDKEYL